MAQSRVFGSTDLCFMICRFACDLDEANALECVNRHFKKVLTLNHRAIWAQAIANWVQRFFHPVSSCAQPRLRVEFGGGSDVACSASSWQARLKLRSTAHPMTLLQDLSYKGVLLGNIPYWVCLHCKCLTPRILAPETVPSSASTMYLRWAYDHMRAPQLPFQKQLVHRICARCLFRNDELYGVNWISKAAKKYHVGVEKIKSSCHLVAFRSGWLVQECDVRKLKNNRKRKREESD